MRELPGFPGRGVIGHAGEVVAGRLDGVPVLMLSGRAHYYEHGDAAPMRPAIETLAALGCRHADPHQRRRLAASRTCGPGRSC